MIQMKQPSLVLHGYDIPGYRYKMWATWEVPATLTVATLVSWIEWAIDHSPEYRLHNVIFNCHGSPGYLHMGAGISEYDLDPFERLRQRQAIGRIWLVACQVHQTGKALGKLGQRFCTKLAQKSTCTTIAADAIQYVNQKKLPYGYIDDFEGRVYCYNAAGTRDTMW